MKALSSAIRNGNKMSFVKRAARQRNYFDFGQGALIRFPYANSTVVERNPTGAWPLHVACVTDADPATVLLKLDARPEHDALALTRELVSSRGLLGNVVRIDSEAVPSGSTQQAILERLQKATSFEVLSSPSKSNPFGMMRNKDVLRLWGKKHPVIGAVKPDGTTSADFANRRIRFTLYDTPGLRKSVVLHKRRLIIVNLHPSEVVRLRKITKFGVRGIRIIGKRAQSADALFRGKSSRRLVGRCVGGLRFAKATGQAARVSKVAPATPTLFPATATFAKGAIAKKASARTAAAAASVAVAAASPSPKLKRVTEKKTTKRQQKKKQAELVGGEPLVLSDGGARILVPKKTKKTATPTIVEQSDEEFAM
jgi:hypothetical protein